VRRAVHSLTVNNSRRIKTAKEAQSIVKNPSNIGRHTERWRLSSYAIEPEVTG
jgi:hypothetical protein